MYLELGLKGLNDAELSSIAAALAAEVAAPGAGSDRSRSKTLDYPVQLIEDPGGPLLRIAWRTNPTHIKRALEALSRITTVADAATSEADYSASALKNLAEPEQRRRLIELARRDSFAATAATRELYKCSLGEARKMLDDWTAAASPPQSTMPHTSR